jgi:hypothetical protein
MPCWKQMVVPYALDLYCDTKQSSVESGEKEEVDDKTENWPVFPRFHEELDKIKFEYQVVPLPVNAHDKFIEPANVNDIV